jgi:hypothetical protein
MTDPDYISRAARERSRDRADDDDREDVVSPGGPVDLRLEDESE